MQHADALNSISPKVQLSQLTMSSCAPLLNYAKYRAGDARAPISFASECLEFNKKAIQWIIESPTVKLVVVSSIFNFLTANDGTSLFDGENSVKPTPELVYAELEELRNVFEQNGKELLLISPTPRNGEDLGRCVLRTIYYEFSSEDCDFSRNDFTGEVRRFLEFEALVSDEIHYISLIDYLCSDRCTTSVNGEPIFRDTGHLSRVGSIYFGSSPDLASMVLSIIEE